jgi:outer membrane receptor protein involved in Fe transport
MAPVRNPWSLFFAAVSIPVAAAATAHAQDVPPEVQISPTTEELEVPGATTGIDLANIVTAAAKGVTTIQEAPAIITVITADDIKLWGHRWLEDVVTDIPGWGHYPAQGEEVPTWTVRGQNQSSLLLHDGVSLFNSSLNVNGIRQSVPLESIKRIEVVTGPGGVLWGANSFQGIVNIITKDAEDVPGGLEAGASYADGRGDTSDIRTYMMTGRTFLDGKLKLFAHASYENYQGQLIDGRQLLVHLPAPQPNGAAWYGNFQTSDQPRSYFWNLDGKLSYGPFTLLWLWGEGDMHNGSTFPLGIVQRNAPPGPWGGNDQNDPNHLGRDTRFGFFDRFAALEYRDRSAGGRVGVNVKGYVEQSVVDFQQFMFLPPSEVLHGGASFNALPSGQRTGITLDGDLAMPYSNRLLFGGEAFYEWVDHIIAYFNSPDPAMLGDPPGSASRLPFLCPHLDNGLFAPHCPVTFLFPASREVVAIFLSEQWRPHPTLTLDTGARLQAAYGERPYDPVVLLSGSAVWNFIPNWHFKLNYAEGFRPPVYFNIVGNGAAVQIGGRPDLRNEFSRAVQGEINARVLRDVRRVRELTFRADYSYSRIDNLIIIQNGIYENAGQRGIHSAEFLGRLYLRGGHTVQLGYTYLRVIDQDKGEFLSLPNHWFTVNAAFNLLPSKLDLVSTLWLAGATEDPNRVPGGTPYQQSGRCAGDPTKPQNCGADAMASNIALDRLPAIADWALGLRWHNALVDNLDVTGWVYNVLDQHYFHADDFFDPAPQVDIQPFPGIGRFFMLTARLHY